MIPVIYKFPIHNNFFNHMIVAYDDYFFCSNCNDILPDYVIENKIKYCPNCKTKIEYDKNFPIKFN